MSYTTIPQANVNYNPHDDIITISNLSSVDTVEEVSHMLRVNHIEPHAMTLKPTGNNTQAAVIDLNNHEMRDRALELFNDSKFGRNMRNGLKMVVVRGDATVQTGGSVAVQGGAQTGSTVADQAGVEERGDDSQGGPTDAAGGSDGI